MISELERWRAAQLLIEWHGEGAEIDAADRADAAVAAGDPVGQQMWLDVLKKICVLQRTEPGQNRVH